MFTVRLLAVGKLKEKFYTDAYNEYAKRLSAFCKFSCTEIQESCLDKEAENVLKYLNDNTYKIAMCIEGNKLSSVEFAKLLNSIALKGYSKIDFIIGGSDGLSETVKKRSDYLLSMSDMTFPHHLARVMVAEQIYRAFKINEGSAYHK